MIPKSLDARKEWLKTQTMTQHFWQSWLKEYLPSLIDRRKWLKPDINLRVDDIVLIADPASPKGKWPIGRIVDVTHRREGAVRKAVVKTPTGQYERPAAKLSTRIISRRSRSRSETRPRCFRRNVGMVTTNSHRNSYFPV